MRKPHSERDIRKTVTEHAPTKGSVSGHLFPQRHDEFVDGDGGQAHDPDGPAAAELDRGAEDGIVVRRLNDADEVVESKDGVLLKHFTTRA